MMERIKLFLLNNKGLLQNFGSLSLVQLINFLIPIIILPYIVRILGTYHFGLVNFALAVNNYFLIIIDYGFNISGVREISVHRDDKEKLSEIFSAIIFVKLFLFFLTSIILIILITTIDRFIQFTNLYFAFLIFNLGNALYPIWFYQGLEKTFSLPLINLFPKLLGIVMIFIVVKSPNDYDLYVLIMGFVNLLIGLIAFLNSFRIEKIRLVIIKRKELLNTLKSGFIIFLSSLGINIYTNMNVIILGILTNENIVGIYAAADKIRIAIQSFFSQFSQSIFPRVNYLLRSSANKFLLFNEKLLRFQSIIMFLISLIVFFFAEQLVLLLLGNDFEQSVLILRILCWLPFVISISNVYAIQILLSLKQDKRFLILVFSAAMLSIFLTIILTLKYYALGTAIAFLLTEIFVSYQSYKYYKEIKLRI